MDRREVFGVLGAMGVALVAVSAAILAALRSTSDLWWVTTFVLLTAIVCGIHCQAATRAFWVGFAVLGWGHWVMASVPGFNNELRSLLPAHHLARYLHPKFQREAVRRYPYIPHPSLPATAIFVGPSEVHVFQVCHSLLTMFFGIVGGIIARYVSIRRIWPARWLWGASGTTVNPSGSCGFSSGSVASVGRSLPCPSGSPEGLPESRGTPPGSPEIRA